MDINYFMKIQNAYGTKSKREKELIKINNEMSKHFEDTFDTEDVLLNGVPMQLMIIKDTDGNTFKKKIKSVHKNKFNLGDYVEWNGQMWLITLVDVDDKTWNRGYMYLCTVPLRWQNSEGKIIERWGYSEDFTKYSSGVVGNYTINLGDNQYGLTIPIDNETKKLKRDMRFSIDLDDTDEPDVYKLTNRKTHLNNNLYFNRGGTIILTLSFSMFNSNVDKKVTMEDGREVWICNYNNSTPSLSPIPQSPDEMTDLTANIKYRGKPIINIGGYSKTFTADFVDKSGKNISNIVPIWKVTTTDDSVNQYIHSSVKNGKLYINIDYKESLLGSKVRIDLSDENNACSSYIIVQIGGGI